MTKFRAFVRAFFGVLGQSSSDSRRHEECVSQRLRMCSRTPFGNIPRRGCAETNSTWGVAMTRKVLIFLASLAVLSVARAAPMSLSGPASVAQGTTFTVGIDIGLVSDLYAFQIDVSFLSSVLQLQGIGEGDFFQTGGGFIPGVIDNAAGSITFIANAVLGPGPGVSGQGRLVELIFETIAPGDAVLSLSNPLLLDVDLNEIPADIGARLTVAVTPAAVPEPSTLSLALLTIGLLVGLSRPQRQRTTSQASSGPTATHTRPISTAQASVAP